MSKLMLIGGVTDDLCPMDMLKAFISAARGFEKTRIFLIPAATEQIDRLVEKYRSAFQRAGCLQIESGCFRDRCETDSPENLKRLEWADVVFFTGGDQLRLLNVMHDTRFACVLQTRFEQGLFIGGSSAGAMALGDPVITRGHPEELADPKSLKMGAGLQIIPGMIVDTHMSERNRLGRLIQAVARHPGTLGLGLDENTGVLLDPDGCVTVFGPGSITVLDGRDWTGRQSELPDTGDDDTRSPIAVENLTLNIYNSGSRNIQLRIPARVTTT